MQGEKFGMGTLAGVVATLPIPPPKNGSNVFLPLHLAGALWTWHLFLSGNSIST